MHEIICPRLRGSRGCVPLLELLVNLELAINGGAPKKVILAVVIIPEEFLLPMILTLPGDSLCRFFGSPLFASLLAPPHPSTRHRAETFTHPNNSATRKSVSCTSPLLAAPCYLAVEPGAVPVLASRARRNQPAREMSNSWTRKRARSSAIHRKSRKPVSWLIRQVKCF